MNRLLIVDDEHHIVNWLSELFSSIKELELEIMKAYSGQETMEILKNYRVDIILLDIQMPGMSGLEVAERALAEWPATHIIFLTAYESFDYLYQANRLENTSYLLKTENDTAIVAKVKDVLYQIKAEIENRNILAEANTRKLLLEHMMQQNFLRTLVHGNYTYPFHNTSEFTKQNTIVPIDFSQEVYLFYTQISGGSFRKNMHNTENIIAACLSFVSGLLYDNFHFCMLEMDDNSMLWFFQYCRPSQMAIDIPATSFLRNISEDFAGNSDKLIHRTLINIFVEDPIPPKDLCHIAHELQQYSLIHIRRNEHRISFSTVLQKSELKKLSEEKQNTLEFLNPAVYTEELSFYLAQKDKKSYMKLLSDLSLRCSHRTSMHDLSVIQLYSSIALSIIQYINQYRLEKKLALKIAVYPLYYVNDFPDWKSAFSYLSVLSEHLFSLISDAENSRNELIISKVEKYIANNISKPLTISDVASCINYNATYVSRLFRQTRGISLNEYITGCRIKLASKLLVTTTESIQNIAYQTGFDTSQYFSIVFKKETGLSPRDFRNSHGTDN